MINVINVGTVTIDLYTDFLYSFCTIITKLLRNVTMKYCWKSTLPDTHTVKHNQSEMLSSPRACLVDEVL